MPSRMFTLALGAVLLGCVRAQQHCSYDSGSQLITCTYNTPATASTFIVPDGVNELTYINVAGGVGGAVQNVGPA